MIQMLYVYATQLIALSMPVQHRTVDMQQVEYTYCLPKALRWSLSMAVMMAQARLAGANTLVASANPPSPVSTTASWTCRVHCS